jgi:NADH:ubiquinone oxidoreductase subunit 6 (subunit J)
MSPTALLPLATATPFPGANYLIPALFLVFVATTVSGALLAVVAARIIRSVCGLALAALGLAGLYYFLNSPFLALMELLIYVGAVCVTIIFAVMLAEAEEPASEEKRSRSVLWTLAAAIVAGTVFWTAARLGVLGNWPTPAIDTRDWSVQAIGVSLLTTYSMAFEVISLVLLVAILGALSIARTGRHQA